MKSVSTVERHNDIFPIKCHVRMCREYFECWNAVMYHVESYHRKRVTRTHECHLCKKMIKSKRSLEYHMKRVHSRQSIFKRPISPATKSDKYGHSKDDGSSGKDKFPIKCHWAACKQYFESIDGMRYHVGTFHVKGKHS